MRILRPIRTSIMSCALVIAQLSPVQAREGNREADNALLGVMVLCPGVFYHLGLNKYQEEFDLSVKVLAKEIAYRQVMYGESESDLFDAIGRMMNVRGAKTIDDLTEASIASVGKNQQNVSSETQLAVFKECLTMGQLF